MSDVVLRPRCELCWTEFDTIEELGQHVAMEEDVLWTIDDDDEDVEC